MNLPEKAPLNDPSVPAPAEERRGFLKLAVVALGGVAASLAGIPVIGAVLFPMRARTVAEAEGFIPVGAAEVVGEVPTKLQLRASRYDAWTRVDGVELGSCWVRKSGEGYQALSSVCPHLGCAVDYLPELKTFNCPCHTSVFKVDGTVASGPSPRPMDPLEVKVEGGKLLVKLERFQSGTSQRIKI